MSLAISFIISMQCFDDQLSSLSDSQKKEKKEKKKNEKKSSLS